MYRLCFITKDSCELEQKSNLFIPIGFYLHSTLQPLSPLSCFAASPVPSAGHGYSGHLRQLGARRVFCTFPNLL